MIKPTIMLNKIMHKIIFITGIILAAPAFTNATLEVIGTGYGRTGTDSLREALNELGYTTYHMKEIIERKLLSDIHVWTALAENDCNDADALKDLFERGGWTAAVDFPASMCWETLIRVYPNAKVIHTERESEEWWDSFSNSVAIISTKFPINIITRIVPFWRAHRKMLNALSSFIAGKSISISDPGWPSMYKKEFVASYSTNNKRVRQLVPRRRLLIHDHSKGWKSLAKFLVKDIPDKPYPHRNTRAELIRLGQRLSLGAYLTVFVFLAITAYIIKNIWPVSVAETKNKTE
ncbi:hypothetical protein ACHAW6_007729 [Cyclotella cf. meneghiniana]